MNWKEILLYVWTANCFHLCWDCRECCPTLVSINIWCCLRQYMFENYNIQNGWLSLATVSEVLHWCYKLLSIKFLVICYLHCEFTKNYFYIYCSIVQLFCYFVCFVLLLISKMPQMKLKSCIDFHFAEGSLNFFLSIAIGQFWFLINYVVQ